MKKLKRSLLTNLLLILFLVILDQITKDYFINKNIKIFEYLSFNFVANTGAVFGLFKGFNWIFLIISILVGCFIVYYYKKEKRLRLSFNFILAGVAGNLIDRISRGYVVDFIDLKAWPVFNLADSYIVIGAAILVYKILKEKD